MVNLFLGEFYWNILEQKILEQVKVIKAQCNIKHTAYLNPAMKLVSVTGSKFKVSLFTSKYCKL